MTAWEYKFIALRRNVSARSVGKSPYEELSDVVDDFDAELKQAGDEGWEAVGQVSMTSGNTSVLRLLLKRPKGI